MESCKTMEEWQKAVGMYEHRGIQFSLLTTPPSTWKDLKQFQVRHDDVFVISYPKSGSHWLMEIIQLLYNGGDRSKVDQSNLNTALEMCNEQVDVENNASVPGYKKMADWDSPRIIQTHCFKDLLPPQVWQKKTKVIYLVRNPKDLAVSMYHYVSQLLPAFLLGWHAFTDYYLSDNFFGGSWFNHVLGYTPHMDDDNVLFVRYEDFYKDLKGVVSQINIHLGCPYPRGLVDKIVEASSFTEMRRRNEAADTDAQKKLRGSKKLSKMFGTTPYLRKSKIGEWHTVLDSTMNEKFDRVYAERMRSSGLTLDFD